MADLLYKERKIMQIPKDPVMLLSYINTQLRDHYASLSAFAEDTEYTAEEIENSLAKIDYHYDPVINQFK